MANAPVLRMIDGGLEARPAGAATPHIAPEIPPQILPDRLAEAASGFSPARLLTAALVSVGLHAGAVLWGITAPPPDDEALAEGGAETEEIIDGVAFISEDAYEAMLMANLPEAEVVTEAPEAEAFEENTEAVETDAPEILPVEDTPPPEAITSDAVEVTPEEVALVDPPDMPDAAPAESAQLAQADTVEADAADSVAPLPFQEAISAETPDPPPPDETAAKPLQAEDGLQAADTPAEVTADMADVTADTAEAIDADMAAEQPTEDSTAAITTDVAVRIDDMAAPSDDAPVAVMADTISAPTLAMEVTAAAVASDAVISSAGNMVAASSDVAAAAPITDFAGAVLPTYDDMAMGTMDDAAAATFPDAIIIAAVDITPEEEEAEPARAQPRQAKPAPKPPARTRPARQQAAQSAQASTASVAEQAARSPRPGTAGAGGSSNTERGRATLSSYQSKLVAQLRRHRQYPSAARARNMRGTAVVTFTVNAAGAVTRAALARSSGHAVLDEAAVQMVHRASPFPPIPRELGKSSLTVTAPVRFDTR